MNIKNAIRIGLIPEEFEGKIKTAGNAALAGAARILLSVPSRAESERIARIVNIIELSTDPFFADQFVERMLFP